MTKVQTLRIKKAFKGIDRRALAKALKSSPRTVDQIANGLLRVSPQRALKIQKITKIEARILRPDVEWQNQNTV